MSVRAESQIDLARVDDGAPGAPGADGTTFTPSVDSAGNISWTNDGGKANPPTQNIMGPSSQYFWQNSVDSGAGEGAGAHITEVTQTAFVADPANGGNNVLIDSDSIDIRDGTTVLASFGASGAVVGENATGKSRTEIGTAGMQIIQNVNGSDTQIANLGYGPGTDSGGGTSVAPYYSFGTRTGTIGNYSTSEGRSATASNYCSHAEGRSTIASGQQSHAEGYSTTASESEAHAEGYYTTASGGRGSHAEGDHTNASTQASHAEGYYTNATGYISHAEGANTTASGSYSHAEGAGTTASGEFSHAQNFWTVATEYDQTVIGRYNKATVSGAGTDADPYVYTNVGDYAFIIGNGSENTTANRSNALTVDWDGNVNCAGYITASNHTNPIGWYDAHNNTSSISSGTTYQSISASAISLAPGRYMLFGSARFSGASSGYRGITIYEGNSTIGRASASQPAIPSSSWTTAMNCSCFVAVNSTTTYKLGVYQNSGSSLSTEWGFYAVAIR